jgi:glycosyltransferase involved in cell wall biosynthesis
VRSTALFLPSLRGGGAEKVMLSLAGGLSGRGCKVELVLCRAEGEYLSQVPAAVGVVDLGEKRVSRSLPSLVRYLKQAQPEVLLSALDHANVAALLAKRLSGVDTRMVVSTHINFSRDPQATKLQRRILPLIVRKLYSRADAVVAVSQGVADDLAVAAGLPVSEIKVVYNPVVLPGMFALAEDSPGHPWFAPGQPPVILGAGRLTLQKDFATLICAFGLARKKKAVRLMILGQGEERERLLALIGELGLKDYCALPGFVPNPYAYMKNSAVFVLSSAWEGFGNVLVEAMALGTPVVSTYCESGPAEILENGKYGRLVEVGDVSALAEAILAALEYPPEPEGLRLRASAFTLEKSLNGYMEVLYG